MQHRGEIVEKAIRQSGYSLSKVAERLGKSRRWIYNAFENPNLPLDYIYAIGKVIHHDFSSEIPVGALPTSLLQEPPLTLNPISEDNERWKEKYYDLLERYNALLESLHQTKTVSNP